MYSIYVHCKFDNLYVPTTVYLKKFSTTHVRVHVHIHITHICCTSCRLQKCRDVRSNVRSNQLSFTIMRNTHFHCIHTYALHTGNIECTLGMVKCAVDTTGLDPVRCYTPNMCLHTLYILHSMRISTAHELFAILLLTQMILHFPLWLLGSHQSALTGPECWRSQFHQPFS